MHRSPPIPTIVASYNRIHGIGPFPGANEKIVKQATGYDALSDGIVRKSPLHELENRVLVVKHSPSPPLLGSAPCEVGDIAIQCCFICFEYLRKRLLRREVNEEVLDGASVSINGFGAFSFQG